MKKYHIRLIDLIANIHDLYDITKDSNVNKKDKEFIQNLMCTVEHYFSEKRTSGLSVQQLIKISNLTKIIK